MASLLVINLSENDLHAVATTLPPKLIRVELSNNNFQKFPELEFLSSEENSLQTLNLSSNQLTAIEKDDLKNLLKLR